jgi:hypothetical protein
MNKKVYCVLEGGDFPEGAPYGIFETVEEAVNFIREDVEAGFPGGWVGSTYIYCYSLGEKGYKAILNHLGKEIK